ncbi:LysR family transcriptional regulator [Acidovorax sp. GBBC 3334]|uniref:LysR family transcriptional regulator n=1 Tax=Acidovorax sp. GBBC 3334 TaxID=2940496 RepID=UPI002303486C|nr:LysR family transcriptional regulator [Acidovorax sp. GBBC 3334]MDA8455040.1 LysR family transcriptional regulator [Acidovorax sp. GBBC 3334]
MRTNEALDSLPDMAVFARVVAAGSFSAAARGLGLTPSAVSRQVARLESVLRVRLLERTTRQLRLTEAGRAAYARCEQLESAAREVLSLAGDAAAGTPRGLVRMSVAKAYGRQRIHALVPSFLAAHPQVDLQLVVTDRTVDLFAEDIDLALRITDTPPPGLAGRPLEAVEHLVCASPAYLAQRGTPEHPRDLAQHDCIPLGEDERDRHWRFVQAGAASGAAEAATTVAVRGRYVANHSEMRREAALAHLGIASLPGFTARAALEAGTLVRVLPGWRHTTDYSGTAWLLYPPNRFLPARVRAWIDHLAAAMAMH